MSELVIRAEWLGARLMADTADTNEEMRRHKEGKGKLRRGTKKKARKKTKKQNNTEGNG
jgi:hypothetical protein